MAAAVQSARAMLVIVLGFLVRDLVLCAGVAVEWSLSLSSALSLLVSLFGSPVSPDSIINSGGDEASSSLL